MMQRRAAQYFYKLVNVFQEQLGPSIIETVIEDRQTEKSCFGKIGDFFDCIVNPVSKRYV